MALSKRKRQGDNDEPKSAAAQSDKSRRVTRQTSIPPQPPVSPDQATSQRRALRSNPDAAFDIDNDVDVTIRRRQRRTLKSSDRDTDDEYGEDGGEDEDEDRNEAKPQRTTRSKAKMEEEPKPDLTRRLRDGKTLPDQPEPAAGRRARRKMAPRRTRHTTKDAEIADSDGSDAEEGASGASESEKSVSDSEAQSEGQVEEDDEELARSSARQGNNTPPPSRQTRRADLTAPTITPVSPPQSASAMGAPPRKETSIKPPIPPASLAQSQSTVARPKKVTEIKPPAAPPTARYPPKTTPIQPPSHHAVPSQSISSIPPNVPQSQAHLHAQQARPVQLSREQPSLLSPRHQHAQQQSSRTPRGPAASSTAAAMSTRATNTYSSAAATATAPPSSPTQPDRNIDKVVLGEICFKAWYPSYYGKEVLGDTSGNTHHGKGGGHSKGAAGKENHANSHQSHHYNSNHHYGHGYGHKENQPILDRLYVCPFCFKYSKEIVPWHGHVQVCESQFQIPGEKVYVHPRGVRTIRVPIGSSSATPRGNKRKRGGGVGGGGGGGNASSNSNTGGGGSVGGGSSTGGRDFDDIHQHHEYIEQVVKDEGEWSIWEVDGERDVLFCQNLSLFAKLFLDNKSVFFDVTGFHYFLLVYTPPPSLPSSLRAAATATSSPMSASSTAAGGQPQASILGAAPRPRVVGFFSKEKMSWDNNNLACILVFPPWQRKGLGALLMGISYEISRREGVLGGPEKPISDLGKKGYKRFWAGEVARWLLSIDIASIVSGSGSGSGSSSAGPLSITAPSVAQGAEKSGSAAPATDELVIDIADCSEATWIVREDCLYVLREMGIIEDAGMGLPKKYCENVLPREVVSAADGATEDGADQSTGGDSISEAVPSAAAPAAMSLTAGTAAPPGATPTGPASDGPAAAAANTGAAAATSADAPREVQRVRISKAAVLQWVIDNHISLEKACDPAGFIKVYTNKEAQSTEEV